MRPPGNEADTQDLPTAEVPAATEVAFPAATAADLVATAAALVALVAMAADLPLAVEVFLAAMAVAMAVVPMVATARCVDLPLLVHHTDPQDLHHLTDQARSEDQAVPSIPPASADQGRSEAQAAHSIHQE